MRFSSEFEIGQHQLGLDGLDVADRVDFAVDMGDVAIDETAHDMGDGVAFADIGQELVAEALTLRSAANQAGDVDEGETRRDDFLGAGDFGQHVKARIGHGDVADIGLDGAEGIIGRLGRGRLRQRVEQGRFADIGQADNAAFETHGNARCLEKGKLVLRRGFDAPYAAHTAKRQAPFRSVLRGVPSRAAIFRSLEIAKTRCFRVNGPR